MMTAVKKLAPFVGLAAVTVGCSQSAEPIVQATPAIASSAAPKTNATASSDVQPSASAAHTPELANPEQQVEEGTPVAAFTPPFPERLDLFEPRQRAQSTVRRDDDNGATVELMGFINVDQPRVVLSIDGVVSSIPEGCEKYGVQVISIEPPTVVLQRGRNRWPATLE